MGPCCSTAYRAGRRVRPSGHHPRSPGPSLGPKWPVTSDDTVTTGAPAGRGADRLRGGRERPIGPVPPVGGGMLTGGRPPGPRSATAGMVSGSWSIGRIASRPMAGKGAVHGRGDGIRGSDRTGLARFGALVAARADGSRRCAQRGPRRSGRRRLRPIGLLRLRHRHPHHRRPGRRRHPPGQLPHHRPVLAHPGLSADRAQPPSKRYGTGGRPGLGLPRLLGEATQGERLSLGDPASARLRHLRRGEMAPHPGGRDPHGGLPGDVAPGPGIRPLVRLPRR